MTTATTDAAPHTRWTYAAALGLALAVIVGVIVIAFLWPGVTASVKNLPIAVVGESAQVDQLESALANRSPDTFDFVGADDRDAAVHLIRTRTVYGAIVLGKAPEVLTASAASPIVSQVLSSLAPALQAQLTAAIAAQGIALPTPLVITVTDVVPLASTDARGTGLAAASFPLVLGGTLGGIGISLAIVGVWRRVSALLVYAAGGGLAIAAIMQAWFGVLQGDYLLNAAAVGLGLLSIGAVITGFVSIIGRAGIGVGPIVFLLIANPLASAAQPIEFLAQPWGAVGQWFPPGAAVTLLRELSYFPDADKSFPWLVLGGWALAGLLLSVVGHFNSTGAATSSAIEESVRESVVVGDTRRARAQAQAQAQSRSQARSRSRR